MRSAATACAALFLLTGCSEQPVHPPAFARAVADSVWRVVGGCDPYWRCLRFEKGTETAAALVDARECYSFGPSRKFTGIYIDEVEGQRFMDGARQSASYGPNDNFWITFDDKTRIAEGLNFALSDSGSRIWEIEFSGREATAPTLHVQAGYGDSEIIVDHVSKAKLVGTFKGHVPKSVLIRESQLR